MLRAANFRMACNCTAADCACIDISVARFIAIHTHLFGAHIQTHHRSLVWSVGRSGDSPDFSVSHFDCSNEIFFFDVQSSEACHRSQLALCTIWMRTRRTADGSWMQVDNSFLLHFCCCFLSHFIWMSQRSHRCICDCVTLCQAYHCILTIVVASVCFSFRMKMRYKCSHAFRAHTHNTIYVFEESRWWWMQEGWEEASVYMMMTIMGWRCEANGMKTYVTIYLLCCVRSFQKLCTL